MSGYAYIENNQISEIHFFLPVCWRNISNFSSLSTEGLANVNWFPIVDAYQDYDSELFEVSGTDIVYEDGIVKRVFILTPKVQGAIS